MEVFRNMEERKNDRSKRLVKKGMHLILISLFFFILFIN